jgi:hypothetical protein
MKRIISSVLVVAMILAVVFSLASCSNISQSYADKINKAADDDKHYTLAQVKEDLGENAVELTVLGTGVVIAVAGCKSVEDIEAKIEAGETVKGIIVTVLANKAISAKYTEITEDDLK